MPAPKSSQEHFRDGTFRADRHGGRLDATAMPQRGPDKPDDLQGAASALWDKVIANMPSSYWPADFAILASCCRWWSKLVDLQARLATATANEEYRLVTMAATASKQFATLAAKCGLSPADRAKLTTAATIKEPANPFEQLKQVG